MFILFISTIFVACFTVTSGEKAVHNGYRVYLVDIKNERQLKVLQDLENQRNGISFIVSPSSVSKYVEVLVQSHEVADVSDIFNLYDMKHSIKIDNLQEHAQKDIDKTYRLMQPAKLEGYLFVYFAGNTIEGEKIYIAASQGNDALNWIELNEGKPILASSHGTRGLRDPFIIRSQTGDKFYLIATDLSIGSGTSWGDAVRHGSRYIEIWESNDLKNWSEQRHVLVSPPTAGNTWAPKAFYDDSLGKYIVFWASSLYSKDDVNHIGPSYHRMLYATTMDFVTFDEPQIWQDSGVSRIDSSVLKNEDVYYRFTKDEGSTTGCTDIIQESSTNLTAPVEAWKQIEICIGKKAGTRAIEGPISFKSNPEDAHGERFYLFVDEYGHRHDFSLYFHIFSVVYEISS